MLCRDPVLPRRPLLHGLSRGWLADGLALRFVVWSEALAN